MQSFSISEQHPCPSDHCTYHLFGPTVHSFGLSNVPKCPAWLTTFISGPISTTLLHSSLRSCYNSPSTSVNSRPCCHKAILPLQVLPARSSPARLTVLCHNIINSDLGNLKVGDILPGHTFHSVSPCVLKGSQPSPKTLNRKLAGRSSTLFSGMTSLLRPGEFLIISFLLSLIHFLDMKKHDFF